MRRRKIDSGLERQFITAMIVSKPFLASVAQVLTPDAIRNLIQTEHFRQVATWCTDFFRERDEAPGKNIETIYYAWADTREKTDPEVEALHDLLEFVSSQYDTATELNVPYLVGEMGQYLSMRNHTKLRDDLDVALSQGDREVAAKLVTEFRDVKLGASVGFDPLTDRGVWERAFADKAEPLIKFPGDAGRFLNTALTRDSLIAIQAPEKRGKCIEGSTPVLFSDGRSIPIADVVEKRIKGSIVTYNEQTMRFESAPIEEYWTNGRKQCYEVQTRAGRELATTGNHEYLTPTGWKFLKDIHVGDFIAVPKKVPFFGTRITNRAELRFVAYMIAEGCCVTCYHNRPDGSIGASLASSFTNTDPWIIKDFEQCCDDLGVGWRRNGTSHHLSGQAKTLIRKHGLAGHSAKTKRIPDWVFISTKKQIAEFLRVVFSCDGSIYASKSGDVISIGLANKPLVYQIGSLLSRFGVVFSIRHKPNGRFESWDLAISSAEHVDLFLREINFDTYKYRKPDHYGPSKSFLDVFPHEVADRFYQELKTETQQEHGGMYGYFGRRKACSLRHQINKQLPIMRRSFIPAAGTDAYGRYMSSDVLWDRVKSIRCIGRRPTFDLSVAKTHNFVAGNCIVHNTWWCIEFVMRALRERRSVAFFQVGDLSEGQVVLRLGVRLAGMPMWAKNCGQVPVPVALVQKAPAQVVQDAEDHGPGWPKVDIQTQDKPCPKIIDYRSCRQACRKFLRGCGIKETQSKFRISVHANSFINVAGIDALLKQWRQEQGFVPDVIVIDYADILAPETINSRLEPRHQANETWKALRRLSQEWHALVISPTQADAASYTAETQTMKNFSEDKRKNAHVTAMLGLNQSHHEKEAGIMRLNWILLREADFSPHRVLHVGQCLTLGRAYCCGVL